MTSCCTIVNLDCVLLGKVSGSRLPAMTPQERQSLLPRGISLTAQAHWPDLSPFLMKAIGPRRGWNMVPNLMGGKGVFWMSTNTPALRDQATHARTCAKSVRPRERAPACLVTARLLSSYPISNHFLPLS